VKDFSGRFRLHPYKEKRKMQPTRCDRQAPEDAFETLYAALRAHARRYLRREQNMYSLSPTMLVHEAWIALARSRGSQALGSDHYLRLVSRIMKRLLVDHARRKHAVVHGGGARHVDASTVTPARQEEYDMVLAVAGAMEELAAKSPHLAALVEMRYFSGFSEAEVAQILGISVRTVRRQWAVARLRLLELLRTSDPRGQACA
jgi:RNA polymerase sigma factor (TIGR02999 family)